MRFRSNYCMPAGDYYIRAYSNWMVNADPEYMYLRDIKIGNAIDVSILSSIEYQKTDDGYLAKIKFFNNTNGVFSKTKIKYTVFDNELKKPIKGTSVTNEEGYIYISLGQFTRNYTQTVKRAADNKRRYAPGEGSIPPVLLSGVSKGVPPLAHDFACKV